MAQIPARAGTVLVVDDRPDNIATLTDALTESGYRVISATNGEDGLKAAKNELPDMVLLDLVMPGIDGFEVCRRLKSDEETRLIPVVFLTGVDSRDARLKGLELGATDFLTKPFDLVELETRVRNLIQYRRLVQELDSTEQMLFAIARAVEARDEITGDHCDRLARLAASLGEHLGLGRDEIRALTRAAYLHDIGKIGIPDAVLSKPGPLDELEWVVMRSHVEIGVKICAPVRSFRPVLPIIRHHHEKLDGSGYPDGLSGEEIPALARIFQVADAFDALTTDRPYRRAMAQAEAIALLEREAADGLWDRKALQGLIDLVGAAKPPLGRDGEVS